MNKPKSFDIWPPEKQEEWYIKQREYKRRWYEQNSEKQREYKRRWYEQNSEKQREYNRRRYEKHSEKQRERNRDKNRRRVDQLVDSYIASILQLPVSLLREHVPHALSVKRRMIISERLKREYKKQQKKSQ